MSSSTAPASRRSPSEAPLLAIRNISKSFRVGAELPWRKRLVRAVDNVSFEVGKGETLGIVGESGCGKSTLARLVLHLIQADQGSLEIGGQAVNFRSRREMRHFRQQVQMVFQDSYASFNPRVGVGRIVAFGPYAHGLPRREAKARAERLLDRVGLDPAIYSSRYPHQLSGGQRQRVNIARALALEPRIVVLDEAVSALDKTVEARVLALLETLKRDLDLTYIFISHDLNVVRRISDRVAVMYLGRIVEIGPVEDVYRHGAHPYTLALLASVPSNDPHRRTTSLVISGEPPSPIDPPPGCRFSSRCPYAEEVCRRVEPTLIARDGTSGHLAACHLGDPMSGHSGNRVTRR